MASSHREGRLTEAKSIGLVEAGPTSLLKQLLLRGDLLLGFFSLLVCYLALLIRTLPLIVCLISLPIRFLSLQKRVPGQSCH
jgi:hypothetical protein